jgi:glycosyltransferase involved in cell wall biosynthesis
MNPAGNSHLHFVQSIEPLHGGGLGRAALGLHEAFRAAGTDSLLVTTCGATPQTPGKPGISEFHRLGPAKLYYARGLQRDACALVADDAILHAHGFYVATNWILGREARRRNRPIVSHVHGFFEPWILARSRTRKRVARALFEDANARQTALWRALTDTEADQIRARGIRGPIVVAPNGVDLASDAEEAAIAQSRFTAPSRKRLVFLGRLHPKKGLDLLVPAWARHRSAARDWELIVAGPDELGYRATVEALAAGCGVQDSVVFTGTVREADKIALLRSADAFILPSRSEGFSVAVLEAMACRVPVAATRACNFPNLAVDGGGWLCDTTLGSVADVIGRVLASSDEERRDRGLAARRLVEQRYGWPRIARTILDACAAHC